MKYGICWRRAFGISFLIHLVICTSIGYMALGLLSDLETEEVIEMELISELTAVEQVQQPNPVVVPQPTVKTETPTVAHNTPTTPTAATPVVATTATVASEISDVVAATPVASAPPVAAVTNDSPASGGPAVSSAPPRGPRSISPPRVLQKSDPRYPEQARLAGTEGTVAVKVEVLENGQPGRVSLQRSSGDSSLDESALSTVQNWQFVPAKDSDSGQAIRCYTVLSVMFRLN